MGIQGINEKIAEGLDFILKNPAIFFSEADIQSIFYENLKNINGLNKLHHTGCTIGLNQYGEESSQKYQTYAIHREYGLNDNKNSRVDLAIFNPDDIAKIQDPVNLKDSDNKYLEPDYIFEFGTEKSAQSSDNLFKHIDNDIEKLNKARKGSFLIHIQRNYLRGQNSEGNREKHDAYQNIVCEKKETLKDNIKVLYFKVDIGGPKRNIQKEGKVKMLIDDKLVGIPQDNIKTEIKKVLRF